MGDTLPAAGYISNASRTTTEMKNTLESLVAILKRMHGVGEAGETVVISSGTATVTKGYATIYPEGAAPSDDLTHIDTTAFASGSVIMLSAYSAATITIVSGAGGTGQINMVGGNWAFPTTGTVMLRLVGTSWVEVFRTFGSDLASYRAYLGLGDAALEDVGSGNGLDADTVDGLEASAFLLAGGTAADSTLLGGVAASDYVRKSVAALQTLAHNLTVSQGRYYATNALGQSSGFEMQIGGSTMARLVAEDASPDTLRLELYDSPGGSLHRGIRFSVGGDVEFYDGSSWVDLFHVGNDGVGSGLDADLVQGVDGEAFFGTGGTSEHSDSGVLAVGASREFTVPSSMCFSPRIETSPTTAQPHVSCIPVPANSGSGNTTRFKLIHAATGVSSATITAIVRYVIGDPPVSV